LKQFYSKTIAPKTAKANKQNGSFSESLFEFGT